jgi:hypothetical protein
VGVVKEIVLARGKLAVRMPGANRERNRLKLNNRRGKVMVRN